MEVDNNDEESPSVLRDRVLELEWRNIRALLRIEHLARAAKSCKLLRKLILHPSTQQIVTSHITLPCSNNPYGDIFNYKMDTYEILRALDAVYLPHVARIDISLESDEAYSITAVIMNSIARCTALTTLSVSISRDAELTTPQSLPSVERRQKQEAFQTVICDTLRRAKTLTDLSLSVGLIGFSAYRDVSGRGCPAREAFLIGICNYLASNKLQKFQLKVPSCGALLGDTNDAVASALVRALASASKLKSLALRLNPHLMNDFCRHTAKYGAEKLSHLPIEARREFFRSRRDLQHLVILVLPKGKDLPGSHWLPADDDLTWLDLLGSSTKLQMLILFGVFGYGDFFPSDDRKFSTQFAKYVDRMEDIDCCILHLHGGTDETVGRALAALVKRTSHWRSLSVVGTVMSQTTADDLRQYLDDARSPVIMSCLEGEGYGNAATADCTLSYRELDHIQAISNDMIFHDRVFASSTYS